MSLVLESEVGDKFAAYHGDCVDVMRGLPNDSVDYSIFSPPFSSLYVYSNSPRDMGNARNDAEFFAHFAFAIKELYRVLKPGRLLSFHCMLMPTSKERDGYIGLRDFRGDLIRAFQAEGFVFHSEVVIWKDPVQAMQRTKAHGLLHKTIRTDSARSRQGIPDYLVTMGKPGTNPEPIPHTHEQFPVSLWQRVASPVWVTTGEPDEDGFLICTDDERHDNDASGIDPQNTLQHRSAREHDDERHICPLQLMVIRRAIRLWSNPGDVVLSPFGGIGSEGYVALQEGRRAVIAELKSSYFDQAVKNLRAASCVRQQSLFDAVAE
jgi:DNA modification methylase